MAVMQFNTLLTQKDTNRHDNKRG